ncbi:hypothetical protein V5N11_014762 [Cardamine amara subsp. amara]|uniref:Uncharacterized protein n=1 Tax=Cardamine amara subsp. amara TaxID=228776 RepID=A0ABD0ZDL1_CARAN
MVSILMDFGITLSLAKPSTSTGQTISFFSSCKKSEPDLSKSELLEALRRSQTRARETENMAKEAYAEKEHMVKLLFKQASELFGYKQWLQLLQLETLYSKSRTRRSSRHRFQSLGATAKQENRRKREETKRLNRMQLSTRLGMSLVGAGLLLGWMQMLSF